MPAIFFYGYWDWRFCLLLLLSTIIDFFVGRALGETEKRSQKKLLLTISLVSNLGILGFFKYFNFFVDSFNHVVNAFGQSLDFVHLNIILPVGISFYTFQTLSYTIDIYRKKLEPTSNFINFALFVSFFPQLVAGPIERAKALLPQLSKKLSPTSNQIKEGVVLIILGLFRKVIIGDTAGRLVDHIFTQPQFYTSFELISALILFSIQIYADFSGYSHMARGIAKLLGVEIMKNFEQPYFSRNVTEFWRRWHISLSSWLKDYLYISLGGNRKGKFRTYINLMTTMLLGGLWHGASWNFVIWGGLHGIYLVIHKLLLHGCKPIEINYKYNNLRSFSIFLGQVLLTNVLVLFTWLFFRASDWHTITLFFQKLFHWESGSCSFTFLKIVISYIILVICIDAIEYFTGKHTWILQWKIKSLRIAVLSLLAIITVVYMLQSDPLPFVYFQF